MSQNSLIINNILAPLSRAAITNALETLATNNSGSTPPATTYANMQWYDTSSNILKQRSEADDAWIDIGYFDQTTNKFRVLDDTQVVNTSGVQTGLLGDQATSTWQSGLSTTQSLVSPANVNSAIQSLTPAPPLSIIAYARVSNATTNPLTTTFDLGFSSMVRTSQGNYTFTFSTARSSVDYMVFCQCASGETSRTQSVNTQSTTVFNVDTRVISSGGATDEDFNVVVYAL